MNANHEAWKQRVANQHAYEVIELSRSAVREVLGRAWCSRVRRQARNAGVLQAARNLRKQGVGLGVARLLLLGRL